MPFGHITPMGHIAQPRSNSKQYKQICLGKVITDAVTTETI